MERNLSGEPAFTQLTPPRKSWYIFFGPARATLIDPSPKAAFAQKPGVARKLLGLHKNARMAAAANSMPGLLTQQVAGLKSFSRCRRAGPLQDDVVRHFESLVCLELSVPLLFLN